MCLRTATNQVQSSRPSIVGICALTLLFGALYFILRALPDAQCGFLHYEEIVNADGSIEFCATNHAGFLDLTRLQYPVEMVISLANESIPGMKQAVTLELFTPGGAPIAPHELAITHTKKMHVMLIDPALQDYHHVHPQADGLNGRYTFEFTPNRAGVYRVLVEIVPLRTRRQVIATGEIAVAGAPSAVLFENQTQCLVDGVCFNLRVSSERLRSGSDYRLDLQVSTVDGMAVELQEIMGAKGHMVAFDGAGKGFAHMHPVDSVLAARSAEIEPELAFFFNVPNPGWYRLFAQVQVNGRQLFGHFDLNVE